MFIFFFLSCSEQDQQKPLSHSSETKTTFALTNYIHTLYQKHVNQASVHIKLFNWAKDVYDQIADDTLYSHCDHKAIKTYSHTDCASVISSQRKYAKTR